MKNISIEERFEIALKPLIEASHKHAEMAERLCTRIDKSNGVIRKAILGIACGISDIKKASK